MIKIGYAVTGSFCTFSKTLVVMQALVDKGYELVPIFRIIPAISTHAFIRRKILFRNGADHGEISDMRPCERRAARYERKTRSYRRVSLHGEHSFKTRKRHNGHSRNACGQGASQKLPSRAYRAVEQRRAGRERKKSRSSSEHEERILCTDGTGRARHKNEIAHR